MPGMVSKEFIDNLLSKSYERAIEDVEDALTNCDLLPEGVGDVELIGTFPSHAIVVTESGEFFRLKTVRVDEGRVVVESAERLEVPMIETAEDRDRAIEEAASKVVDAFFKGSALSLHRNVADLVGSSRLIEFTEPALEIEAALDGLVGDDRLWKRRLSEQRKDIMKAMWGRAGASFRDAQLIAPKYKKVARTGDASYYQAVMEDLGSLHDMLKRLYDSSIAQYAGFSTRSRMHDIGVSESIENFDRFASDWIDATRGLLALVEWARSRGTRKDVRWLAMLHDRIAENMLDLDIGSRVVLTLSNELNGL